MRQTLKQIEEQWLQWIVQNNRQQADRAVDGLLDTARQLGMRRLPDLSAGAIARAVQAARQKDFARAHWELDAAERFDPGRPGDGVRRGQGGLPAGELPGGAVAARLRGYPRLLQPPLRALSLVPGLLLWVSVLLLVTGGLFLAVQMLTKGTALFQDLADLFGRKLPRPVRAGAGRRGPALAAAPPPWRRSGCRSTGRCCSGGTPRGASARCWSRSGSCWAPRPMLVELQRQRVAVALSPPALAMESLEEHRLYGSLFSDLGVLRAVLPESVAVKHLLADVHRSLNQWELARSLYRQVLEAEPNNAAALLNLGDYSFLKGDFSSAIQNFQKAATADPPTPPRSTT